MEYTKYFYQVAKDWLFPPPPAQLTPLQHLQNLLTIQQQHYKQWRCLEQDKFINKDEQTQKQRSFYFATKHTSPNIVIQRICMMYSSLNNNNPNLGNFYPIIIDCLPFKNLTSRELSLKQLIGIKGNMKINTSKVKYSLQIIIVFHPWIQSQLPWVQIVNVDSHKMQLNRQFQRIYEQTLGGVLIKPKCENKQKTKKQLIQFPETILKMKHVEWSNYRPQNLQNYLNQIQTLINSYFPFVKRFISWEEQEKIHQKNEPLLNYQSFLKSSSLMETIQKLTILSYSLDSERQHLQRENEKMKKFEEEIRKQEISIDKIFQIKEGNFILDMICQIRAYQDCMGELDKQIQEKSAKFEEVLQLYKELCQKKFEKHYLLSKALSLKENQSQSI